MPRPRASAAPVVDELDVDEGPDIVERPSTYKTEDEKIAAWCDQMLRRGQTADDADYVRDCARREADLIRPTRPDLAAKLDAVAATLTERLPIAMR
jgi:hypothetical protein